MGQQAVKGFQDKPSNAFNSRVKFFETAFLHYHQKTKNHSFAITLKDMHSYFRLKTLRISYFLHTKSDFTPVRRTKPAKQRLQSSDNC